MFDTDTLKKVLNNAWENKKGKYLDENGELKLSEEELMHELGKDVGGLVAMLLEELLTVGSGTTARAGKMFTKEVWEEFGEQAVRQAKQLLTSLNKRAFDAAEKLLSRKALAKLADDIGDAVDSPLARALNEKPELVKAWKVLDDANVPTALKRDPDKLTKVNRYLDNNPTKKDGFIDDLKNTSDPEKFVDKTSHLDDLGQQYGLDFDDFVPQGISKADVPQQLYDDMLSGYSDALSPQMKENFLNQLIESGSSVPTKVPLSQGDELFKVIPKGNELTQSSFYMSKSELDNLKAVGDLEQKLGLPLGSHSVEYDVYKAVAKESVDVFESTVAPTLQKGYQTTGGATQTFIMNSSKWDITKVETILP